MKHLIGFFHYLTNIKLYHWCTKSHARHEATDELYGRMQELVDQFIEALLATYECKEVLGGPIAPIKVEIISDEQAIGCLDDFKKYINENAVPWTVEESNLRNITDDMLNAIDKCKYKFLQN